MAFSRTVTEAGVIPVPVFRLYSYFTAGPVHPGPKDGSEAGIGPMGMVLLKGENKVIGKFVKLTHAYGFTTVYGHLSQIKVTDNGTVHIGQVIGLVGNTGRSTGPHLHYGVKKNGKEQNPLPYCYLYLHWLKMLNCEGKNSATLDHASSARSLPSVSSQCADLSPRSSYTRHQESPRFRLCELQYIPQAAYS